MFLMMLHFVNAVFSSGAESPAPPGQVQAELKFFSSDGFGKRKDEPNVRLKQ